MSQGQRRWFGCIGVSPEARTASHWLRKSFSPLRKCGTSLPVASASRV